jgi:uncharacterized protein with ParB-like and HNH nuclease domain
MQIKPRDTTIKTLLESGYYLVPRFQRPYSWDRENVDDLWQDAIVSDDEDYFIGSFVFWTEDEEQNRYYIVDGQQRLITITLLLVSLRNALAEIEEEELASGIHNLIERPDIYNNKKFVLYTDTPYPYFQEHIQKFGEASTSVDLGREEITLKTAFEYLNKKVNGRLASIDVDSTIAEKSKSTKKVEAISAIRDKILRLKLIVVEIDNEDDAYLVFETLNTRGKDLTVSDLVKNLLTRLLRNENQYVDIARDKWISIQRNFNASEIDININTFILYSWLSRYPYTSKNKLFREIKQYIDSDNASAFLDDLVSDATTYRRLVDPSSQQWSREEKQIFESIKALNIFHVAQPLPIMIALLRDSSKSNITKAQAKNAFQALEKFHATFTAITSQRIGGGTARLYASSAQQLFEAADKNAKNIVIRDFIGKMRDRKPSLDDYRVNFSELFFSSTQSRQRGLVRYILSLLDSYWRGSAAGIDYEQYSIEHISPEAGGPRWPISENHVGKVGNLIFVTQDLNEQLGSKPFKEKIALLKESHVPMDDTLSHATDWTDQLIEQRTTELAEISYNELFRF